MTYDSLKVLYGKQAITVAEIFVPKCTRVYGTAPCTAAIPTTGDRKCFNTFATCQDKANFASTDVTVRFSTIRIDTLQAAGQAPTLPTLMSVDTAPTVLTPGKGLGVRSSVRLTIQDHPWTDIGFDPYPTSRTGSADMTGTMWGKFLARNKYYINRRVDILTGFLNEDGSYDAANMRRRSYVITAISGPTGDGKVTVEARDPLRLADDNKVQWPRAGNLKLLADLNTVTTTFSVANTTANADIVNEWTAGQSSGNRYLRIDQEIVRVASVTLGATIDFVCVRATMPSWYDFSINVALEHEAETTVQLCWFWQDEPVQEIVHLLLSKSSIDPAFIPLATWNTALDEGGFQYLNFSTLLTEPIGVKTLLEELTNHNLMIWWDERSQIVRMKGLLFQDPLGAQINDSDSVVAGSMSVGEDVKALATQVWIYRDDLWPLAERDLLKSYRTVNVIVNTDSESDSAYGQAAVRTIRSRWLPKGKDGTANSIAKSTLRQYSEVRKVVSFDMDPKDDDYSVGDTVGISTFYVQDDQGLPTARNYLITQMEEVFTESGFRVRYTATELFALVRTGLITPDTYLGPAFPDYTPATAALKRRYGFIAPNTGNFPDGGKPYQITY